MQVASYIDQPGLVLELAEGMIHTAKQHQWAEPLRVSLREFLNVEISAANEEALAASPPGGCCSGSYRRANQPAAWRCAGACRISLPAGVSVRQSSVMSISLLRLRPLDGVGYEALVTAETKLLIQLSKAIARELK